MADIPRHAYVYVPKFRKSGWVASMASYSGAWKLTIKTAEGTIFDAWAFDCELARPPARRLVVACVDGRRL